MEFIASKENATIARVAASEKVAVSGLASHMANLADDLR